MTMPGRGGRHHPPAQPGRPVTPMRPPAGGSFTDQVMARVAVEPRPSPGRVFFRSLGHLAVRDALAALLTAWRLAFEPAAPVPASARASAAALFLSVVFFIGIGGSLFAAAGLSLLGANEPAPEIFAPAASPTRAPAVVVPSPSVRPSPRPSPLTREQPPDATKLERDTDEPSAESEQADKTDRQERTTPKPKPKQPASEKKTRETPEPKERERDDVERESDEKDD